MSNSRKKLGVLSLVFIVGACATVDPAVFDDDHPANSSAAIREPKPSESPLRGFNLPAPRHPLSEGEGPSTEASDPQPTQSEHEHGTAPPGDPVAEVYTCPMHPEVVSQTEGRCPICEMKLERKSTQNSSGPTGGNDE